MPPSRFALASVSLVLFWGATSCADASENPAAGTSTVTETVRTDTTSTDAPAPAESTVADSVLLVPDEFSTVQAAVDAAVVGDTVLVSPGTYAPS